MPSTHTQPQRIVRLFVALPSDVVDERLQLAEVVEEFNRVLGKHHGVYVETLQWETHASPGLGRAEEVVLESMGDFDIMVGIMWSRFGTPTGKAGSGTEEEFDLAYDRWTQKKVTDILFYFCEARPPYPRSEDEPDQLQAVLRFKAKVQGLGMVWTYSDRARFRDIVRPQLTDVLIRKFGRTASQADSVPAPQAEIPSSPPAPPIQPVPWNNPLSRRKAAIVIGVALSCVVFWFSRPVTPVQSAKTIKGPAVVQPQPSPEREADARTHIEKAKQLFGEAQYSQAIRELNTARQLAPSAEEKDLRQQILAVVHALPAGEQADWKKKIHDLEDQ